MAYDDETQTKATSFMKHLVNDDSKHIIMNMAQYSTMALLPVVVLNKSMQHIFPEVDETKNNLEIVAEVLGQVVFLFACIYFIDRAIRYVKTYSGKDYQDFNMLNTVLPFIVILLSMQSKMGQKINIVADRLMQKLNITQKQDHPEVNVRSASIPIQNDMRELVSNSKPPVQSSPQQTNGRVSMPVQQEPPQQTEPQQQPQQQPQQPQQPTEFETVDAGAFSSNFSSF